MIGTIKQIDSRGLIQVQLCNGVVTAAVLDGCGACRGDAVEGEMTRGAHTWSAGRSRTLNVDVLGFVYFGVDRCPPGRRTDPL